MKNMKILVIAPHMDDEVLGCGGTICRHVEAGDEVDVIFVAHRIYDHIYDAAKNNMERSHALKAKEVLGYRNAIFLDMNDERLDASVQDLIIELEQQVGKLKPEVVYIPFRGDNHQDHRAVFDAARVVLRPSSTSFIKKIYMYEVPSSTEQSPVMLENAFLPARYVNIKAYIDDKIKALLCYETEKRTFPNPRSQEAVRLVAGKRGTESGFEAAEAFMVIRSIWE
jgi:LmbE family N-acetylglucosaminyl deacetylase